MQCFRKIVGKTRRDRVSNVRIREELVIEERMAKRQLNWFGHVVRMGEHNIARCLQEVRPAGKRERGSPRKTYLDVIEELGKKKGTS